MGYVTDSALEGHFATEWYIIHNVLLIPLSCIDTEKWMALAKFQHQRSKSPPARAGAKKHRLLVGNLEYS